MNVNKIYLEKKLKVLNPFKVINLVGGHDNKRLVASINRNLEKLGYILSRPFFNYLSRFDEKLLSAFYQEIIPILKKMKGAGRMR